MDMSVQWRYLDEEVAATQMPDEYRDVTVWILCRDCHKVVCLLQGSDIQVIPQKPASFFG